MSWNRKTKIEALALLVTLARELSPEEVFQCLAMISEKFARGGRLPATPPMGEADAALTTALSDNLHRHEAA